MTQTACAYKVRYTKKEAQVALGVMRYKIRNKLARDRRKGNQRELHIYHCERCDGWHVGHRTERHEH